MSTNIFNFGLFFKERKPDQSNNNKQFKGPEAYQVDDKNIFKGREVETQQLLYMVEHNDWCVCYARSGEGKSSLINAGLKPSLLEKQILPIDIRFETDLNSDYLKDVDFDDFVWDKIEKCKNLTIIDTLSINPGQTIKDKLWWKLRSKDFRVMTENSTYRPVIPLLIFDQFEEVFTRPKDLQWTYNFFKWLEELYKDEIPVTEDKGTNLDFCEYSFSKKFKVLLSLRNEYVSELDYWSMEKFFIPSLKNNRYYLKPLTFAAAKDVTQQLKNWPRGIDEDNVIKAATNDKDKFFEVNEEDKTGNQSEGSPCVSALILSLILSKLEENDEFVRQKLIKMEGKENLINNKKEFMENLFDHIYEDALLHCGVGLKSSLRDRLEVELMDDNGRRKRARIEDFEKEKDLAKIIEQLKEKRIVCINNGEVELSHDSICATVARHRTQRIAQLKEQRETAFIAPTLVLFFLWGILWGIRVLLNETTLLQVESMELQRYLWVGETVNLIYIPLLIVTCTKKVKNTPWVSFGGAICNIILLTLLWQGNWSSATNLYCLGTSVVSLVFLIYALRYKKDFNIPFLKTITNNTSFLIYLFALFLFVFIQCIWGDFYSISLIPANSFWGVIILPPLACYITTKIMGPKLIQIDNKEKLLYKAVKFFPHVLYLCLLCLLSCDTAFLHHRFLPYTVLLLVFIVLIYYTCFSFKRTTTPQRVLLAISNFVFFLLVYVANLGYNPLKITYNSAKIVYNWSLVYTLANNGKWGVLDAVSGDTLMPCIMDSSDFSIGGGYCDIKSDAIIKSTWAKTNSELNPSEKTIDSLMMILNNQSPDGSFRYNHKNHMLTGRFWLFSKLERLLKAKENVEDRNDTSIESQISFYSAKVFKELRQANLQYLLSGKPYTLHDIPSFHILDSLQFCNYESVLESTLHPLGEGNLTDMGFHQINRALARTFLLCAIKDKINQKDLKSLFIMSTQYSYLYFAEDASWQMNYNGQFNLPENDSTQTRFYISGKDFKDKAYSYYYMFLQIVSLDISVSLPNHADVIKLQKRIDASFGELLSDENLNEARNLSARRPTMDASQLFANVNINKDNKEGFVNSFLQNVEKLKGYDKKKDKWKKDIDQYAKQTKTRVDQMLADMNRLHVGYKSDDSFERINEKTSIAFISYIERFPMSPYNMGFVRILQALCSSGFYRGYDMNEKVDIVKKLVENNKDLTYDLMIEYGSYENQIKERKEKLEAMSRKMQEIIEASQKSNLK